MIYLPLLKSKVHKIYGKISGIANSNWLDFSPDLGKIFCKVYKEKGCQGQENDHQEIKN